MRKALLSLLCLAFPILAQPVYSYKDSNGNTVYTSDQPPANVHAEQVKLPTIQTMPTNKPSNPTITREPTMVAPIISEVRIDGIPTDGTLRENDGSFTVTISLQTANNTSTLPPSYLYQLLLDGKPYGEPQSSPSFMLVNLDRGDHTIQANIFNKNVIIASSDVKTFTLKRASANPPAYRVRPQPR